MAQEAQPATGAEEREFAKSPAHEDADSSTEAENARRQAKDTGVVSKETEQAITACLDDVYMEAATTLTKVPTHKSTASIKSHSIISKRSRRKTREELPSPVLPTTDLSKNRVGWESQTDPEMPLNFSPFRKWLLVALLSVITFMSPFASSILAPALGSLEKDYSGVHCGRVSSVRGVGTGRIFRLEKYGWCLFAIGWAADV